MICVRGSLRVAQSRFFKHQPIIASQIAQLRLDGVAHKTRENTEGFREIEVGDFVLPALTSDLVERRFKAAGDELFV